MKSRKMRSFMVGLMVLSCGVVFGSGVACPSFAGETFMSTFDFCFLFDCQNGALGGLLDPCNDSFVLFTDCPNSQANTQ